MLIYIEVLHLEKDVTESICKLLNGLMEQVQNNVLIVGDFNFLDIDWNSCHSRGNDPCSTMFLDTIQSNFLNHHVDFPTRIRVSDTPVHDIWAPPFWRDRLVA